MVGMETQLQFGTYSLEHCSTKDLNVKMSNGMWSMHPEQKALENCQHYGTSAAWQPLMVENLVNDKERVRETIEGHESIFRHQVQELHRLYRRQRDLMNEIRWKEAKEYQQTPKISPSNLFSSHISSEEAKRMWRSSHLPSSNSMLGSFSLSGSNDKHLHSPITAIEGKCLVGSLNSREMNRNILHGKPIDLGIPVDVHMINEETTTRGRIYGVVGNGIACQSGNLESQQNRFLKRSLDSVLRCHYNAGDSLTSNEGPTGVNCFSHLREPVKLFGSSLSSATKTSSFQSLLEEISHVPVPGLDGKDNVWKGNEQMIGDSGTGRKIASNGHFSFQRICSGDSVPDVKSFHAECRTEHQKKQKIFGVEISVEDDEPSPLSSDFNLLNCKSNKKEADSSDIPSWRTIPTFPVNKPEPDAKTSVSSSLRFDSSALAGGVVLDNCAAEKFASSGNDQNGLCVHPELISNGAKSNLLVGFDFMNCKNAVNLQQEQFRLVDSIDQKAAKRFKSVSETTNMYQGVAILEHDPLTSSSQCKELPLLMDKPQDNGETTREKEHSPKMNLASSQKCAQHIFRNIEISQVSPQNVKQESKLSAFTEEAEDNKIGSNNSRKILGFHLNEAINEREGNGISSSVSEARCSETRWPNQLEVNSSDLEKGLNEYCGSRNHIDLNLSMNEDEFPSAPALPEAVVRIATTEIDLEVPPAPESEAETRETKLSGDESQEPHQELIKAAAEAIIAISSSLVKDVADCTVRLPLEAPSPNRLKWLADVVSSYGTYQESKISEVSDEESIPEGMDYFEFMTLQLKEVKKESYSCNLPNTEQKNDEETAAATMQRQPRRRRGRQQRKDFQRHILPTLVSLSKQEMVEDFQTFEQLLQSSGCTRHSDPLRATGCKNGQRRRRPGSSPPSSVTNKNSILPSPQEQQPICRELQLMTDQRLPGWGKKTRRFPRRRCLKVSCSPVQVLTST